MFLQTIDDKLEYEKMDAKIIKKWQHLARISNMKKLTYF